MSVVPSSVVDAHVHVYPEKISQKAAVAVNAFYENGGLWDAVPKQYLENARNFNDTMLGEHFDFPDIRATVKGVLSECANTPISHHIIYSVATTPAQVTSINDFIAETCQTYTQCIGFAAMHQDFENPAAEIDRAITLGLRGVKIHPDFQEVNIDDPRLMPLYEAAQAHNIPITIHTGDYRYDFSNPKRLIGILHDFPSLVVDAAHMGGWAQSDQWIKYLDEKHLGKSAAKRCFVDTSSSTTFLTPQQMREAVEIYGPERVMFGSDYPMWNPAQELDRYLAIGLSERENEIICKKTPQAFLQMDLNI